MATNEELAFARQSLIEELDAINKYEERVPKTKDEELKKQVVMLRLAFFLFIVLSIILLSSIYFGFDLSR